MPLRSFGDTSLIQNCAKSFSQAPVCKLENYDYQEFAVSTIYQLRFFLPTGVKNVKFGTNGVVLLSLDHAWMALKCQKNFSHTPACKLGK